MASDTHTTTLNLFFTCHENYGDLLYPIIIERLFNDCEVVNYGLVDTSNPLGMGSEVLKITDLLNESKHSSKLLFIGGGAILRNNTTSSIQTHLKLLGDRVDLTEKTEILRENFKNNYLAYDSIGPFILNEGALTDSTVVYFSCGFGASLPTSDPQKIVSAFDKSDFIYVREHLAKKYLENLGVRQKIYTAPDIVTIINQIFPEATLREHYIPTNLPDTVNGDKKLLIFQSNFINSEVEAKKIIKNLNLLKDRYTVMLMPAAFSHNDHLYLQYLANEGNLSYYQPNSVFDMIYMLARSDFIVSTSMHFAITAFSYTKPFVVYSKNMIKIDEFLAISNINSLFKISDWLDLSNRVAQIELFYAKGGVNKINEAYNTSVKNIHDVLKKINEVI